MTTQLPDRLKRLRDEAAPAKSVFIESYEYQAHMNGFNLCASITWPMLERMAKVLEFYASQDNWVPTESKESNLWAYTTIYQDSASNDCLTGGQRAREALREFKEKFGEA